MSRVDVADSLDVDNFFEALPEQDAALSPESDNAGLDGISRHIVRHRCFQIKKVEIDSTPRRSPKIPAPDDFLIRGQIHMQPPPISFMNKTPEVCKCNYQPRSITAWSRFFCHSK